MNQFSNHQTAWVNEHVFDGIAWLDDFDNGLTVNDAANILKIEATESLITGGLSADGGVYITAFLGAVQWQEIAQNMHDLWSESQ